MTQEQILKLNDVIERLSKESVQLEYVKHLVNNAQMVSDDFSIEDSIFCNCQNFKDNEKDIMLAMLAGTLNSKNKIAIKAFISNNSIILQTN